MAEALAIEKAHGENTPVWIASRVGALALAGDAAGVERFKAIASAYQSLRQGTVQ
ncbi:DUF6961 family protein [Sphingomonas hankookensis]|uniref:DUF6961 family protein n=1 Tax=Sphingomonas hankookensis TaxID=563996 RepID=UPI001F59C420|nr:hypothetical protein [Sphingomonas hankookensis]